MILPQRLRGQNYDPRISANYEGLAILSLLKVKSSPYRKLWGISTAKSGYIQRRIIKICEDIQIKYDGTVRDSTGKLYQFAYGENGFDPCSTVKVDNCQQFTDITRLTDKLNLQYEIQQEKIGTELGPTFAQLQSKQIEFKNNIEPREQDSFGIKSERKELSIITDKRKLYPVKTDEKQFKNESKEKVEFKVQPKPKTKLQLLKELASITGKSLLYRDKSVEELIFIIEKLKL